MVKLQEIYISVDVESTGKVPGRWSMSSFGAFAAGGLTVDGKYVHFDHTDRSNVFYKELKPISEEFVPEAINVGVLTGFDSSIPDPDGTRHFEWMKVHGEDPKTSMEEFAKWVTKMQFKHGAQPIFMGYPAVFDWTFIYWYLANFDVESPFGFSRALDLKTTYAIKAKKAIKKSSKKTMPRALFSKLPHTHRADDDAIEQGIFGINLLQWNP
jgi:hypothetical protein